MFAHGGTLVGASGRIMRCCRDLEASSPLAAGAELRALPSYHSPGYAVNVSLDQSTRKKPNTRLTHF